MSLRPALALVSPSINNDSATDVLWSSVLGKIHRGPASQSSWFLICSDHLPPVRTFLCLLVITPIAFVSVIRQTHTVKLSYCTSHFLLIFHHHWGTGMTDALWQFTVVWRDDGVSCSLLLSRRNISFLAKNPIILQPMPSHCHHLEPAITSWWGVIYFEKGMFRLPCKWVWWQRETFWWGKVFSHYDCWHQCTSPHTHD